MTGAPLPRAAAGREAGHAMVPRLLAWLSPAMPTGAYSYSHGIETAVALGVVTDERGVAGWVASILCHGAGRCDAVHLCAAHRAAEAGDETALLEAAALAATMVATAELALETFGQGEAFLTTVRAAWPAPLLDRLAARAAAEGVAIAHPVAVGAATAAHGIPLSAALRGFLFAYCANLVSAAVRIVPLGQTQGQRIIASLEGAIEETATAAEAGVGLGSSTPMVTWTSILHETQYSRIFRS
jgi:urease accessory protein